MAAGLFEGKLSCPNGSEDSNTFFRAARFISSRLARVIRRRIFANNDFQICFNGFAEQGPKHGAWIGAYVIMPDHLHTFVVLDDQRPKISDWVKSLKNALSKVLRRQNIRSPHWPERLLRPRPA